LRLSFTDDRLAILAAPSAARLSYGAAAPYENDAYGVSVKSTLAALAVEMSTMSIALVV
jgi:hypothetical protein